MVADGFDCVVMDCQTLVIFAVIAAVANVGVVVVSSCGSVVISVVGIIFCDVGWMEDVVVTSKVVVIMPVSASGVRAGIGDHGEKDTYVSSSDVVADDGRTVEAVVVT